MLHCSQLTSIRLFKNAISREECLHIILPLPSRLKLCFHANYGDGKGASVAKALNSSH